MLYCCAVLHQIVLICCPHVLLGGAAGLWLTAVYHSSEYHELQQ